MYPVLRANRIRRAVLPQLERTVTVTLKAPFKDRPLPEYRPERLQHPLIPHQHQLGLYPLRAITHSVHIYRFFL